VADALLNDNWISDVVHDLSPALMAQYIMLWILLDAVPFDREETADDEIIWRMTANGAYLIGCGKGSFLFIDFEGPKRRPEGGEWESIKISYGIWPISQNQPDNS
jgi:hypothetical protein